MSKLPTLLRKGFLKQHDGDKVKQIELDEYVPIEYIVEWFKKRLFLTGVENRVLILKSKTASGKSTAVPATLFSTFIASKPVNSAGLICTQPRRITAIKNVGSMREHYKILRLGDNVGWATQYDKMMPAVTASLFSATLGTLTQQLKTMTDEELIARYQIILIDECHERSVDLDITVAMLKSFILRNSARPDCPFVCLMSATFNEGVFLDYFNIKIDTNYIFVDGFSFPPSEKWETFPNGAVSRDLNADIVRIIANIVNSGVNDDPGRGDLLVFLPSGKNPELRLKLEEFRDTLFAENRAAEIFSIIQISSEAQEYQTQEFLALDEISLANQGVEYKGKLYVPKRRVILSTNVAETGLTLDGLKYVLDSGFNKETEFNPIIGMSYIAKKPAPQSRVRQRIGRCGRKFPGIFYPMYPREIFDKLQEVQYPDILTSDITAALLDIIMLQLKGKSLRKEFLEFRVQDIDLMDVPSPDAIQYSLEKLNLLGLISPVAREWSEEDPFREISETPGRLSITRFGLLVRGMLCPAISSVESCRAILAGFTWDVSILDLITIAIYIQLTRDLKPAREGNAPPQKLNWEYIYEGGIPPFIASDRSYYKMKAIIADQFIEGIILFNSFSSAIIPGDVNNMHNIDNWFTSSKVNRIGMIKKFIVMRDALIEQMLGKHINVLANEQFALAKCDNAKSFIERITAIKRCIYDGYRDNLITRSDDSAYATKATPVKEPRLFYADKSKTTEIKLPEFFTMKPKYCIYNSLGLAHVAKGEIAQRIEAELVSVMDNYVGIDALFNV